MVGIYVLLAVTLAAAVAAALAAGGCLLALRKGPGRPRPEGETLPAADGELLAGIANLMAYSGDKKEEVG